MEILKIATEWAKAEVFSTRFFILFAILFLIASIGFWQMGKTDLAKAYIIPTLVAGILLLIIGSGLNYTNIQRVKQFEKAFNTDASAFYQSEIERSESTL
jgi:predicted membrane channel-forming protein YqfA (hemolysin III family)